jgi:hypothetical protein
MHLLHYLHTLAWLLEKLAEGDPVAWCFFLATILLVGAAFAVDLWTKRKRKADRVS